MLGHLVSNSYPGAPDYARRRSASRPAAGAARTRQHGWLGRIFAQLFERR